MTYEQQSILRNLRAGGTLSSSRERNTRAGGTGSYEFDSAARERRLRRRQRQPGESQTSADTRAAASRTTPSHFIPFSVRQAQYGRGKAAKSMAQFQASSAGQEMGMGGTTDNPYGGFDTQNQSTAKPKLAPDPVGGGQTPFYVQPETDTYKGIPNSSNDVHRKPTINPNLFSPQGQTQAQPGGFLNRLTGAAANSPALGIVSKLAGVQDGSPQAKFMRAKADGTLDASGIAKAHKLARSMGTTFDPATGYNRTPFMESTRGKSYDPTAEAIEGQKSKSKSTLPAPTGDDVEASFQMPDGTMRTIRANESVEDGFKRARTPRPEKESTDPEAEPSSRKTGGITNAAAFSPESEAQKNPMLREQPIERSRSTRNTQSQSTKPKPKPKPPQRPKPKPIKILNPIAQAKEDFRLVSSTAKQAAKNMAQGYMDSRSSPEKFKDKNLEMLNRDFEKLKKGVEGTGAEMPPNMLALFEKQAKANRVQFSFDKGFYK